MKIDASGNLYVKAIMEGANFSQFYPDATFTRSSQAWKSDGTSVSADFPRFESGKFGTGVLIEEGTTNLVLNSDFEVLNASKQRVFFDDFNRTPILTFTRSSTNSSKTMKMDFVGKVSGSLVENPHVARHDDWATFQSVNASLTEFDVGRYSNISTQDASSATKTTSTNGNYAQERFSFDVLTALKRANLIPQSWDVATLKANLGAFTVTWVGYGVGSNAGVSTNGASTKVWSAASSGWYTGPTNTSSSPSTISFANTYLTTQANIVNCIDANGFLHLLAHSTYSSNGTIASTIYTDYVKLDVTVTSPDLAINPETGAVVQPGVERYVNGRFQNLLLKNQSDAESGLSNMTGSNLTVSQDTTRAWQGTASFKGAVTSGASIYRIDTQAGTTSRAPVMAGRTYMFSGYVWADTSMPFQVLFDWYDQTGTRITATWGLNSNVNAGSSTINIGSAWTRVWFSVTAPSNAVSLGCGIGNSGTASSTFNYWVDGLQLEEIVSGKTSPTDWRQGGTGKGVFVEEGTVNLLTANQSSVETDTTGFTNLAGTTISRDTANYYFGTASLKCVTDGTASWQGFSTTTVTATASTTYTLSVWLKASSNVTLQLGPRTNGTTIYPLWKGINVTTSWQQFTITYTTLSSETAIGLSVQTGATPQATTFYVDGLQLEQKAYATSWILGGSTRNAETLTVPTTGMSPTVGTWEQWVYVNSVARRQTGSPSVFAIPRANGNRGIEIYHSPSSAFWVCESRDDTGTGTTTTVADSFTPDGWHLFSVSWTSSSMKIYIDGVLRGTITTPLLPTGFSANATIGYGTNSGNASVDTYHDAIRVSNVERTATEVLAYFNATSPLTQLDDKTVFLLNFDGDLDAEMTVQSGWNLNGSGTDVAHIKGNRFAVFNSSGIGAEIYHGDSEWTDVDISCKITYTYEAFIYARYVDGSNFFRVGISNGQFYAQSRVSGTTTTHYNSTSGVIAGTQQTVRALIIGNTATIYLDGTQKWTGAMAVGMSSTGKIAVNRFDSSNNRPTGVVVATFDDIEVKADVPSVWGNYVFDGGGTLSGGYICLTSATKYNGTKPIKVTAANPNFESGVNQNITTAVIPGSSYTLSAYVQGAGYFYVRDNTNSVTFASQVGAFTGLNTWTRQTYTFTVPAGCTSIKIYCSAKKGNTAWFDAVQVEQKGYVTSYHRNDSLTVSATRSFDSLTVPTTNLSNNGPWTIECWMKSNVASGIHRMPFSAWTKFYVSLEPANKALLSWKDATNTQQTAYSVSTVSNTTGWHYWVLTFDGSTVRVYVDGVKVIERATTLPQALPSTIAIGAFDNVTKINGIVDAIRVSNIVRSDTEILAGYNSTKGFVSDQYTLYNYKLEGNLKSHTDVPMVLKNVSGTETLYLRGSVVQNYSGPLLSATNVKAALMPDGTFYIRGTKTIG